MKYIDAELLREEIERLKEEYNEQISARLISESLVSIGKVEALNKILSFIDSLQQEQPDCHTVEDWIGYIKNADQFTKDIFSKGPYDVLYDALNHPYQHCYDAIKEFGELCFQTGVNSVKQKQPSLPDNLDEAAHSYSESDEPLYSPGHRFHWDNDSLFGKQIETAFIAGAQWMENQFEHYGKVY